MTVKPNVYMIRCLLLTILSVGISNSILGQSERKYIRRGNDQYIDSNYSKAEEQYRKSLEEEPNSFMGEFNLADALYKQEQYEEAASKFLQLSRTTKDKDKLAKVYHNLGNSWFKAKQLDKSIEAYKKALLNNPNDMEAKHNLAYAQRMKQQQQQQQQNKKNNKDQQNKDQQQQQEQQQQNRQDKNKEKKQQQQQQQNQQDKNKENEEKQGQKQEQKISKKEAEQMLRALELDEKKLQERMKEKKARQQQQPTSKDW